MSSGVVATFYSYKGGVGRTLALANVAILLTRWGYRVLCVDWDLEAPGLHLYFRRLLKGQSMRGLVELLQAHTSGRQPSWQDFITEMGVPRADTPLSLITAGALDEGYVARMQSLQWESMFSDHDLGRFLEAVREGGRSTTTSP